MGTETIKTEKIDLDGTQFRIIHNHPERPRLERPYRQHCWLGSLDALKSSLSAEQIEVIKALDNASWDALSETPVAYKVRIVAKSQSDFYWLVTIFINWRQNNDTRIEINAVPYPDRLIYTTAPDEHTDGIEIEITRHTDPEADLPL